MSGVTPAEDWSTECMWGVTHADDLRPECMWGLHMQAIGVQSAYGWRVVHVGDWSAECMWVEGCACRRLECGVHVGGGLCM